MCVLFVKEPRKNESGKAVNLFYAARIIFNLPIKLRVEQDTGDKAKCMVVARLCGIFDKKFPFLASMKARVLFLCQGPVSSSRCTCVTEPAARCDPVTASNQCLPDPAGATEFFYICLLSSG